MFEKTVVCVMYCGGGGGGGGVNVTIYIICNGYYHFLRRIYEFNFTFRNKLIIKNILDAGAKLDARGDDKLMFFMAPY